MAARRQSRNIVHATSRLFVQTSTKNPNYFNDDLLCIRQWQVYVLPWFRHKTSTAGGDRDAMKKNVFCLALGAMLFALCFSADAQQPKKVSRLGYLSSFEPVAESARAEGIRLALRERGHIEGQNITIEYRYAEGKIERAPELAAELVRLKVDIIVVAGGTGIIQAAKNATKTIPIVMTGGGSDLSRQA
jgi:hypothetical protein